MDCLLTPFQEKILTSKKPYIFARGTRRIGKTIAGISWVLQNAFQCTCTTWIITPDIRRLQFIRDDIMRIVERSTIKSINKIAYFETIIKPTDSKIYFITDRDLFDRFPVGRRCPDFIFMDDVDFYSKTEQRKLHHQLKWNTVARGGNPKIFITSNFTRKNDRLQALWAVAKNKDSWECISSIEYNEEK